MKKRKSNKKGKSKMKAGFNGRQFEMPTFWLGTPKIPFEDKTAIRKAIDKEAV